MIRNLVSGQCMHGLAKSALLVGAAFGACQYANAQEIARVVSTTPVIQKVGVPQKVCTDQQVAVQGQKSGTGAVLGAVAGGVLGDAAGHGHERGATTLLGAIGGAVIGNQLEDRSPDTVQTVRQCSMQTVYQDRVVGFNVVYEYAGRQYSVQSPQDPGPTLQIQIVPVLPQASAPVVVQKPYRYHP